MTRFKRHLSSLAFVLTLVALAVELVPTLRSLLITPTSADEDDEQDVVKAPSRVSVTNGIVTLTLNAKARQNAGIIAAHPGTSSNERSIAAYGVVLDATALTTLRNQYVDAESQVHTAEAKLAVTRGAFDRADTLYKDGQNVSKAQLQSAEGDFSVDQAALAAAQARLANVSASAEQAWGPVLAGALMKKTALIDDLINRRDYLVKVTAPPGEALDEPPPKASVTAKGGAEIALHLVSPATSTEPSIQGVSYFYLAPATNEDQPGRNLMVSFEGTTSEGAIVPQAAVVWLGGKPWIYLRTSPATFVRQQIAPRGPGPGGGYVVKDLARTAEVVVQGAQMLLSEEFRGASAGGEQD